MKETGFSCCRSSEGAEEKEMGGNMKILRVDMGTGSVRLEELPEKYALLGNRSLVSSLIYDEVVPTCSPIGPNNRLYIASSPLEGFGVTSTGRISVGAKSPLTGGIKEANAGGTAGSRMARQGLGAIAIEGAAEGSWILRISSSGSELLEAPEFACLGTYATTSRLLDRFGRDSSVISIGPAGENLLLSAGVFVSDVEGDSSRAAARGGLGAVMGSKGLKAIVIQNDGTYKPEPSDKAAFIKARLALHKAILENPGAQAYTNYGTMGILLPLHALGTLPGRGFTDADFKGVESVSGEKMLENMADRGGEGKVVHSCMPGCVIRCSNVYPDKNGRKIVSPLEYETSALLGTNLCIDDLDVIAELNRKCNDYGIDTIETGAALGVAAHAGILGWGDGRKAAELIDEIGKGTHLGKILGSGAVIAGKVLGVNRVPAVKGQAMAGYDPRGVKSMGATYAMTPMGADHTAAVTFRAPIDQFRWEGGIDVSRNIQVAVAFYDTYFCSFVARGVGPSTHLLKDLFNTAFGTEYQDDSFMSEIGKECIKRERMFNLAAGVTEEWLPEWMREEPLEPHGRVADIPASEFERFWDKSFWGEFPPMPKRF